MKKIEQMNVLDMKCFKFNKKKKGKIKMYLYKKEKEFMKLNYHINIEFYIKCIRDTNVKTKVM